MKKPLQNKFQTMGTPKKAKAKAWKDVNSVRSSSTPSFEKAPEDSTTAERKAGYKSLALDPCDDAYTGEGVDQFYGEAVDDKGTVGFVERNNYLDRQ